MTKSFQCTLVSGEFEASGVLHITRGPGNLDALDVGTFDGPGTVEGLGDPPEGWFEFDNPEDARAFDEAPIEAEVVCGEWRAKIRPMVTLGNRLDLHFLAQRKDPS